MQETQLQQEPQQITQQCKYENSLNPVNQLLEYIMSKINDQISKKQLQKHYPSYAHFNVMEIVNQQIMCISPDYGRISMKGLSQQLVQNIPKISKDNLSPKQVQREQSQLVKDLPDFLSESGSKKLSITNRSAFLKRKSSQMSPLRSVQMKQKDVNKKTLSIKKDPYADFKPVPISQQQDPQIVHLRQKSEYQFQQSEKQMKIQLQRKSHQQERIQSFNSQFQNKGYTFDFSGDTIGSENTNEKLIYLSMKTATKTIGKKFNTLYNQNSQLNTSQEVRGTSKKVKNIKQNYRNQELRSSFEIPMFSGNDRKSFNPQVDPIKMKLTEYKKLYGRKFSRYNKQLMTIDVSHINDRKQTEQDYFGTKKHFHDSNSINKSARSSLTKEPSRKLALPRLQGKYKVLDRYEQL